jgi:hypothetical protein
MILLVGRGLVLSGEGLSGSVELVEHPSVERLEAPSLGWSERFREGQLGEVEQCLPDVLEASLELDGLGRDRGRWLFGQAAFRVAQEIPSVGVIRDSIGRKQGQGLPGLEPMALDGPENGILLRAREGAEAMGQRGSEGAPSKLLLCEGGQVPTDIDSTGDPCLPTSEPASDLGFGEAVVVHQRADDPCLIERRDGALRGVGDQQQPFEVLGPGRSLEHDGDLLASLLFPSSQALESIDDLVAPVVGRHDPQRKLRQRLGRWPGSPWAKRLVAGP